MTFRFLFISLPSLFFIILHTDFIINFLSPFLVAFLFFPQQNFLFLSLCLKKFVCVFYFSIRRRKHEIVGHYKLCYGYFYLLCQFLFLILFLKLCVREMLYFSRQNFCCNDRGFPFENILLGKSMIFLLKIL